MTPGTASSATIQAYQTCHQSSPHKTARLAPDVAIRALKPVGNRIRLCTSRLRPIQSGVAARPMPRMDTPSLQPVQTNVAADFSLRFIQSVSQLLHPLI